MDNCIMNVKDLNREVKDVFGNSYNVKTIRRILGGAQKGTYKIECENDFSFVLYIWDKSCDYFETDKDKTYEFTSNSGVLFEKNSKILRENNISIPKVYFIDITRAKYYFEFAFVEYIENSDLEHALNTNSAESRKALEDLSYNLKKLHSITNKNAGQVGNFREENFKCEDFIYKSIFKNIGYLNSNYMPFNSFEKEIRHAVNDIYASIKPRRKYSLIHSELGPNHVMLDKNNKVYLIDFEGMKFFDLEFEHSLLEFRFGDLYKYLKRDDLDENRMQFYKLYHHIGCAAGAYELILKDYYDKDDVENMFKYNYNKILEFIR